MARIVIMATPGVVHHAAPLLEAYGDQALVTPEWRPSRLIDLHPDLVVSFEASNTQRALCGGEMLRLGIPMLQVADGIQEWRYTWSRGRQPGKRPINQPVLAHKIACLGQRDRRLIESWGNVGKCEVVGAYRLDRLVEQRRPLRTTPISGRPARLLVMTARTPGFTAQEVEITLRSLVDLRNTLAGRADFAVTWRVTRGLEERLGVHNSFSSATGGELHSLLAEVDAVVTTPSTAMLEGMLFGHPVAILDYLNTPHFVQAAWRITAREQIDQVLTDLIGPPLERMLFQDFVLHEALSCREPGLPRMIRLMDAMAEAKQAADRLRQPLSLPYRIITDDEGEIAWPNALFDLQKLYPLHPIFAQTDCQCLQGELDAALRSIDHLSDQVEMLEKRLYSIPGYRWISGIKQRLDPYFKRKANHH